jgi:hypothetical protein
VSRFAATFRLDEESSSSLIRITLRCGIRNRFVSTNSSVMHRNRTQRKWFAMKKVSNQTATNNDRITFSSGSFACSPSNVVLFDQLLFIHENGRVNVASFQVDHPHSTTVRTLVCALQGTSRQSLSFAQNEGEVNSMSSNGSYLVIGSTKGYVKVFDISRR